MPNESFPNPSPAKKVEILDAQGNKVDPAGKEHVDEAQVKELAKKKALEALKNQKAAIVDASHLAEMEARDAADAHMTESKGKAGFWKKLWKHTFFDEYYRQKELNKVRNEILKSDNIYSAIEKDKAAHDNAMGAIATRFASEYDEAINKTAGESKDKLKASDNKAKTDLKNLIISYAQGNTSEEIFKSTKDRIFHDIKDDSLKGATTYADNLFEIAKNAKLAIEHGAKLEELDFDLENITVGKAKSSIKTEARNNWVDKAVDKAKHTKIGKFVNPATLATSLGLVYSVGAFMGKKLLRNKFSHAITFGGTAIASGLLMAANESQRLSLERRQHGREMAKGAVIEGDTKRRKSMEEYAYQTESAKNLIDKLRNSLYTKDEGGNEIPKQLTQAEINAVMANITEVETRESFSNSRKDKIDLISYSHPSNVEKEHTEMVILLARAKVEMRKQFGSGLPLPSGETSFDAYLAKQVATAEKALLGGEKGITKQDKAFAGLKRRRAAWVFTKTLLIGATIGAAVQEGVALLDDHKEGIFEGIFSKGGTKANVQTPLEYLRGLWSGHPSHISMENAHEQLLGNDSHFKLPEGSNILENNDGTFNIIHGDRVISDHIKLEFNADGTLKPESIALLGKDGIIAGTSREVIDGVSKTTVTPHDYMQNHIDKTTHISRSWMDNDTNKFDQNELRTQWGGVNGTGIDANGDYVMNIEHMTNDGSFHSGMSVEALNEMKQGKLEVLFSVTKDTQTHVLKGVIGPDGLIHIKQDSIEGKMLFENVNGHAQYNGAFIEIAKHDMNLADGREHMQILSTVVGTDHAKSIEDSIADHTETYVNTLELPLDTEGPYFIPAVPRTPLEPIAYKKPKEEKKKAEVKNEQKGGGEEIPKGGFRTEDESKTERKKIEAEISEMEYGGLEEDIKMLNKRIQQSKGIITLNEADFISDYGQERYNALKSIADGKPVTFNREELRKIGDEMEEYLTKAKKAKTFNFKGLKTGLKIAERQLQKAKDSNDHDAIEFLARRVEKMEKSIKTYESQMKNLKEKLKKAEKSKIEEDVEKAEDDIEKLEQRSFRLSTFS